jgi:hypothetical protein
MNRFVLSLLLVAGNFHAFAQEFEAKPADPYFEKFQPKRAPQSKGLLLQKGDRLAICGDSITEQKMYSRIIETYLTVCVPELEITARQYGWSGETAPGFLNRMTNDCLRFKPTIATTAYGMNDHGYRAYAPQIGETYRKTSLAIIQSFKNAGARVVLGSPGPVGKVPTWTRSGDATKEQLNLNLCELRNIDIELAASENVAFADVFWPMFTQEFFARQKYGENYAVPGKTVCIPIGRGRPSWLMLSSKRSGSTAISARSPLTLPRRRRPAARDMIWFRSKTRPRNSKALVIPFARRPVTWIKIIRSAAA